MATEHEKVNNPYIAPAADPIVTTLSAGTAEATLGARIGGYVIDVIVVIGIASVMSFILGSISGSLSTLGTLVAIAYILLRDSLPFLDGQSLGKKVVKIRAVTEEGVSLSGNWGPGLVRNVVLLIPLFPLVELVVMVMKNGKSEGLRRLGDQWGKTKVVRVA